MKNIKRINETDVEIDGKIYREVEEPKPYKKKLPKTWVEFKLFLLCFDMRLYDINNFLDKYEF